MNAGLFNETIDAMHRLVADRIVPGVSYGLFNGRYWSTGTIGQRQWLPNPKPLVPGLTYDVASLTKVVATLPVILQLIEERQLSLQDSISDYLPEWQFSAVRVFNLLTHTSGIEGYIPNRNQLPEAELIDALLTQLHVGENLNRKMVYADVNFIFLGWIAERILGQPIQNLAVQRVLNPLGMQGATFSPHHENCVPTETLADGNNLQGQVDDPKAQILGAKCGSAGLFATLSDLMQFTDEMLQPTGTILHPKTIQGLLADHTINGQLGRSYGWALGHEQRDYLWQTGYTGTAMILDPVKDHAFILLSNRIHPKAPNEAFIPRRNQIIKTFLKA